MRMVASDLDGTIVRPDGRISGRTLAALKACEARGIAVVFVTGRPPRWMAPIAEATGHHGLAICGNGAVLYNLGTEQIAATRAMSAQSVLDAVRAVRDALPSGVFALETTAGYRREAAFLPHHEAALAARVGAIQELLDDDPVVLKILCRVEGVTADPILAAARAVLHGIAEPVHSDSAGSMIEISAPGVSKASTLALVAQERQIDPAEVVAFGDMPNDVPMLRWAGRGYAMADGHQEAIAAADEVAPPCAQDGVAQVLERLLAARPAGAETPLERADAARTAFPPPPHGS
jgi:Cof subfamily protein (haloacid dehalogenase superfamily)